MIEQMPIAECGVCFALLYEGGDYFTAVNVVKEDVNVQREG